MFSKLLKRLFKIPPEQNLVWGMIAKQGNVRAQILSFLGFMILLSLGYQNPAPALAFIIAMYGHELGHWLIFTFNQIKTNVWLIFPFGAVAAPINKAEDERSDQLHWWNISWMLQAGPAMNLALMLVGYVLLGYGLWPIFTYEFIFINGLLGVFNLLPLGNLDGGQLFNTIFSSLKEKTDVFVTMIITALSAVIFLSLFFTSWNVGLGAILWTAFSKLGLISFLVLFAAGIWQKQGKDNPLHSQSPQAMTGLQITTHIIFYTLITTAMILGLGLL